MLDRTIPYYNLILRCDRYEGAAARAPAGFSLRPYRPGDERAWAELETAVGDFDSVTEAERYFRHTYLSGAGTLSKRGVFLADGRDRAVGACIAWRDPRGGDMVASLHWLVLAPELQGRGLGRVLCRRTLEVFRALGEFPVYLHTQPWSWKAVRLYVSLGFQIQKSDTFSHYENQYAPAMETLRTVLDGPAYADLAAHSQA